MPHPTLFPETFLRSRFEDFGCRALERDRQRDLPIEHKPCELEVRQQESLWRVLKRTLVQQMYPTVEPYWAYIPQRQPERHLLRIWALGNVQTHVPVKCVQSRGRALGVGLSQPRTDSRRTERKIHPFFSTQSSAQSGGACGCIA